MRIDAHAGDSLCMAQQKRPITVSGQRFRSDDPDPAAVELFRNFPETEYVDWIQKYEEGRSGAKVWAIKLKAIGSQGLDGSFVVKIADAKWALEEQERYRRHFEDGLAHLARLCGVSGAIGDQVAIAYELAFDRLLSTRSLRHYLLKGNASQGESDDMIVTYIREVAQTLVSWNRGTNALSYSHYHPYDLLMFTLGRRWHDLSSRLTLHLPSWNRDIQYIKIDGYARALPNPAAYLSQSKWDGFHQNLATPHGHTHGDLNTSNIICRSGTKHADAQGRIKLIDFADYQRDGAAFADLAYFEFDIFQQTLDRGEGMRSEANRRQLLSLLDFSMRGILPKDKPPTGVEAERAWRLIRPVRQAVKQMIDQVSGADAEGYISAWWNATVAAGLNFARKGGGEQPTVKRVSGLLYAAYGLERLFHPLGQVHLAEATFQVNWLQAPESLGMSHGTNLVQSAQRVATAGSFGQALAVSRLQASMLPFSVLVSLDPLEADPTLSAIADELGNRLRQEGFSVVLPGSNNTAGSVAAPTSVSLGKDMPAGVDLVIVLAGDNERVAKFVADAIRGARSPQDVCVCGREERLQELGRGLAPGFGEVEPIPYQLGNPGEIIRHALRSATMRRHYASLWNR